MRKLAAEDRSLQEEVQRLRTRLTQSEAEAVSLRSQLERRVQSQAEARARLNSLIERLNRMQSENGDEPVLEALHSEL